MFTKKFKVESSDVDEHLNVKLSSLMRFMQDVATSHAEELGVGKANTIDKGLYWVITRYALTVVKCPKYLENINVSTYPGNDMKFIFPRYFMITSESGELLVKASTSWMVLKKDTRGVCLNPFDGKKLPPEHMDDEEPLPRKVIPDQVSFVEKRQVRYSDIDLNGHLNNTKYIEYVLDMKSTEFYREHKIKHILINYEKELLDGQAIDLYSNNMNPEYIIGKVNDNVIFEINIEYDR